MLHVFFEEGFWFEPKRHGIGAGWPTAWQGWALIAAYLTALAGLGLMSNGNSDLARISAFALFLVLTGLFLLIAARRTRGGWHWRWGDRD